MNGSEGQDMLDQTSLLAAWDRDHFSYPSTHMGMHARGESSRQFSGVR